MTPQMKTAVVLQFKHGTSVDVLALWHDETQETIEQMLREALLRQEKQAKSKGDA